MEYLTHCMLPDGDVLDVFKSICASTQSTQKFFSENFRRRPLIDPEISSSRAIGFVFAQMSEVSGRASRDMKKANYYF